MSRLTRDGTAEPVSRDQKLRHERGQRNINFSCSADHVQDWQPYPVDPYCCYMCDHTIHANRKKTDPLCRARKRVPRRSRFWRWVIDHELLTAGESLSAPCFAAIKRPAINILPVGYKLQRDILSKNQNLLEIRLTLRTFDRTKM